MHDAALQTHEGSFRFTRLALWRRLPRSRPWSDGLAASTGFRPESGSKESEIACQLTVRGLWTVREGPSPRASGGRAGKISPLVGADYAPHRIGRRFAAPASTDVLLQEQPPFAFRPEPGGRC